MEHRNIPMCAVYNKEIICAGNITIVLTDEHYEMY